MSLWAEYKKERLSAEVIEESWGFIAFKIFPTECFILDLYVGSESRQQGKCKDLVERAKKIAREAGCEMITGQICPTAGSSTETMVAAIKIGFKLHSSVENKINIYQDLKNG